MPGLRIPPLVKWSFAVAMVFLVFMTALRLYFFSHFTHSGGHYFDAFLLGIRYDLRMACIIVLPVFLIGSLYNVYKTNKLSVGSKVRLILVFLFTLTIILFLKNNKYGVVTLASVGLLYAVSMLLLYRYRNLNPFAGALQKVFWLIYFYSATFVVVLLYVVDIQHFDYLHQRLNASVLGYTKDAGISLNMVWQSYPVLWMLLITVILFLLISWLITRLFRIIEIQKKTNSFRQNLIISICFSLLLVTAIFGRISQYPLRWSDAYTLGTEYKANLALNPLQSFFSSLAFKNSGYDLDKVKSAYPLLSQVLNVDKKDSSTLNFSRTFPGKDSLKKPNVVLVICESFSGYKSSMWGNPLNTTPYFNELCKRGIFFDRCFTPAYGTARGVWSIITGIPDVEPAPNTASRNPAAVDQRTIINDFAGYEKFYFLGGSTSWANIRGLLTNNIKDLKLYEEGSYKSTSIDVWGISDKHLFYEANDVLKKQKKPFFAIIQTAGNHRPYTIPSEDKDFINKEISKDSLKKYGFENNAEFNAFRYTDYCFKKFMDTAEMQDYFENTLFVFIGDHGIRGDAGNMLPRSFSEMGLTTQHVPLLFYAPSMLKPSRSSATASQLDVLPSIAGATGIGYTNYTLGKNLFDNDTLSTSPFAFLFDPDKQLIGVVSNEYCYMKQLVDGKETVSSLASDELLSNGFLSQQRVRLARIASGWYETARYMLLNNKK